MSDINVTPMVDVMLVLVVILILTAPLLASRIALSLPQAASATQAAAQSAVLRISVRADGVVFVDDAPVAAAELGRLLRSTAAAQPQTEVQLRADAAVPYGVVVRVMDAAQQAGLSRIGFVATKQELPR